MQAVRTGRPISAVHSLPCSIPAAERTSSHSQLLEHVQETDCLTGGAAEAQPATQPACSGGFESKFSSSLQLALFAEGKPTGRPRSGCADVARCRQRC